MEARGGFEAVSMSYFSVAVALRRPRACLSRRSPGFVRVREMWVVPASRYESFVSARVVVIFLVLRFFPWPVVVLATAASVSVPLQGAMAQRIVRRRAPFLETETVCLAIDSLPWVDP